MYKVAGQKIKRFITYGSFYDEGVWLWVDFENKDGERVRGKIHTDDLRMMVNDFVFEVVEATGDKRMKYDHLENPESVYDDEQEVREEVKELF